MNNNRTKCYNKIQFQKKTLLKYDSQKKLL